MILHRGVQVPGDSPSSDKKNIPSPRLYTFALPSLYIQRTLWLCHNYKKRFNVIYSLLYQIWNGSIFSYSKNVPKIKNK